MKPKYFTIWVAIALESTVLFSTDDIDKGDDDVEFVLKLTIDL